jgi:predicted phosphate transport protein (TIGR00153 family)
MPFGALLPKEYSFFDFFEQHAAKSVEAAHELRELLRNVEKSDALTKRIKDLEHEGDKITHHTVETLHKTFITPIDREEIHQLISKLDDVLDFIDATAQRIKLYEIRTIPEEACELCEVLVRATEQVKEAVMGLRALKYPMELLKICVEINRLENEGDTALRKGVARLFKESKDPIEVIKWKEIYEFLEAATDRCEDVANIIEGVVLEHA